MVITRRGGGHTGHINDNEAKHLFSNSLEFLTFRNLAPFSYAEDEEETIFRTAYADKTSQHRWSGDSSTDISLTANSSTVSTHRQGYKWAFHQHLIHRQGQLLNRAMLGVKSSTACMKLFLQEPPLVAPDHSFLDPTGWLDGARPANTCISPSFP